MTHLWGISRTDIEGMWPRVENLVAAACSSSQLHSPDGIKSDLANGISQLWIAWEGSVDDIIVRACLVTKIEKSPIAQWCRGILVAGNKPDDWFDHIETIEKWAKDKGCGKMNFIGRCGLEHWLKPKGYQRTHFLMEKAI